MATLADTLLLEVLKACEQSNPDPLYPVAYAAYSGLDRDLLDEALDHLRLRGLVRFTDWVQGKGQGYAITSQGTMVLQNPSLLRRVQPQVPAPELTRPADRSDSPWSRGEAVRDALVNPVRPVVTMTLFSANIIIFVMGMVPALQNELRLGQLGDLVPFDVLVRRQWWRILTYAFLHAGFLHVAVNMYALYSMGPLLESMWGSVRFLVLYLVAAFVGGCAVLLGNPMIATVGASGALCGLLTSLGVWILLNKNALPPQLVSNGMRTVVINLVLMTIISTQGGISWQCHLGGAIGGAVVSVPLNYHRFGQGWQKILGLIGTIAVPLAALGFVVQYQEKALSEPQKVQRDLYPIFWAAEKKAAAVCNSIAVPLFKDWGKTIDKTGLAEAREAFKEVQQHLQEAVRIFDQAGPYKDKRVIQTVQRGRDYLEEWLKFFTIFSKTIEKPPPWPPSLKTPYPINVELLPKLASRWKNPNSCL